MDAAHAYGALLEAERSAALHADLDGLERLQDAKHAALLRLRESDPPAETLERLGQIAAKNVELIRHLVSCLRGLASLGDGDTYTALGQRAPLRTGSLRGVL